jgi:hypothetical protein
MKKAKPDAGKPEASKKAVAQTDDFRILKIATCPSLSGKSTLTYHVGCEGTSGIRFRVYDNSGGGFWSKEWVSTDGIQRALGKDPLITAASLNAIFSGKSANNAGFLLAVLKHEGLVGRSKEKPRCYERTESEAFVAEVKALMESGANLDPDEKPKVPAKKAAMPVKAVAPVKTATASARKAAFKAGQGKA